ncbi:hypothetical protein KM043_005859 [Ampulex compressa]|nr:hypothetical protein KM043_005859 [Ampulex compressa]
MDFRFTEDIQGAASTIRRHTTKKTVCILDNTFSTLRLADADVIIKRSAEIFSEIRAVSSLFVQRYKKNIYTQGNCEYID